ncbi:BREX-1 system adenine-specific DNA-methyltransferase PglX [Bacteroides uniformis]|uniref:BREX-1 system adenine-specific DNA-methyltransferase PglX n=1 Tax=Bacteroides uniformis TaxID=820 RepID=UPI0022E890B3|nr:BREX-1 system adenine-specific DNA-methyltransferase PglX [Bacteroides uniformis]
MDTNRLKRFATEARNILMQGVVHRLSALGFLPDGSVTEEPQQQGGGATFMGDTVTQDFYDKWQSLRRAVTERGINEVAEEAAYTWFNRLVAIRILVKNGLASPVLEYESEDVLVPLLVSEARQGRMPEMDADSLRNITDLLDDDSKTSEQFALLIVAYCHSNPVINKCFGRISDYTELLLPTNILTEGGFVYMLNHTEFISEEDYRSPELIGWLYQFYISEKKDDVFASFKKGMKAEAKDIPAATQIFTPNWIVKYMVQNTVGRIYLDNNPYSDIKDSLLYLVEPEEATPADAIFRFDDIHNLTCADLACGSGHILNECFDLLYQLYIEEGYSRKNAIEDIFKYNLTGVDIDTRAKQLAQFALLLKACQKDSSFADAHCMPKVLDMPMPYDGETVCCNLDSACLKFIGGYENVAAEMLEQDMELIKDAKNLGSIMNFNDDEDYLALLQHHYDDWTDGGIEDCPAEIQALIPCVELILTLTKNYAALVMNPPYMGAANMNKRLKEYLDSNYIEGKSDLMTAFMMKAKDYTLPNGYWAMIDLPSWMFLGSFEELRKIIIDNQYIASLLHLGRGIFGSDFGSVAFTMQNCEPTRSGSYRRLFEEHVQVRSVEKIRELFFKKEYGLFHIDQLSFKDIPGNPIGYWISRPILNAFQGEKIRSIGISDGQNITGNNLKYMRFFWEVCQNKSGKERKWVPMAKGGDFRKWYGNIIDVVNWSEEAQNEYRKNPAARIQNSYLWYRKGITWNLVSSLGTGFRYLPDSVLFNKAAPTIVFKENCLESLYFVVGYLNTKIVKSILNLMNPTINTNIAEVFELPLTIINKEFISKIAASSISISQKDWDSHETSWDFVRNELLTMDSETLIENINYEIEKHYKKTGEHICINPAAPEPESLEWCYNTYCGKWERMFMKLHENEEELNRQFIDIYGLQDELTPDVPLDEITILQQGEISIENDHIKWHDDVIIKQLISYAVGCMVGRYSIDKPGLILANQGDGVNEYNEKVPNSRFEVDDDGIIPLMASDTDFSDNATLRFKQWLTVAFGDTHLVENLNFIEGALGKSLDDYFARDFWKDHKKMYQNRPIYWLFSSKKGAFQCIAYMHRMNAYTAERIRTKYLLPHIEWLLQKQSEMEENAANLSTAERRKLDNIRKQIAECREYHDRLHVVADEQIAFDLDDGVVVNYAKFGDVLSKLK